MDALLRPPTDDLETLARGAAAARIAASGLRWLGACAVGFAALLVLALVLASFERERGEEPSETSASAYLDFDLAVLRELASRSLSGEAGAQAHRALAAAWSRRPDWLLPPVETTPARLASVRDAWAAVVSDRSRFRTAARGAADALPFLLAGLALVFCGAAIAGVLANGAGAQLFGRWAGLGRAAFAAGVYGLVLHPLWPLLDPAVFYDRTLTLGSGASAAFFVAAFAGTLSGAAARALLAPAPHAQHLSALRGRPALLTAARIAAVDAAEWLVPLVPALAAAALFVCAKADQDAGAQGTASGLGALVRAAMREPSAPERVSSCLLVGGALVVLCFLGHRFVIETRQALGASKVEP
ncbi:MAG: hypothetical protein ACJ79H_18885 [Myxococcales bacterium]